MGMGWLMRSGTAGVKELSVPRWYASMRNEGYEK